MNDEAAPAILAELPPPQRGSRLDPHLALIRALRRRGHSYRDILHVLQTRCGVRVGLHTLFHFVRTRVARSGPRRAPRRPVADLPIVPPVRATAIASSTNDDAEVQARIAALKRRITPAARTKEFQYDEHEPLQLTTDRSSKARRAMTTIAPVITKRVILSMGGKGGVGKTNVMTALAEWFQHHQIPVTLLDLDTENKTRGSLTHFFGGEVPKINIHTPEGLDAFLDYLDTGPPIVLADMGSGAGRVTHTWFDQMHGPVSARGIVFTAVGVVTADPASVESVLTWADRLQRRVAYVIVENEIDAHATFTYWQASAQALTFQQTFTPAVMQMAYRLPHLEMAMRNHGVTLTQVMERQTTVPELQLSKAILRAAAYRAQLFEQFERVKGVLLP
jgi:MinD-like ATPase involved in chromosome partitioning or flagellar assembly